MSVMKRLLIVVLIIMISLSSCTDQPPVQATQSRVLANHWQQWAQSNPSWVEPMAPYRVIGNLYQVGTVGLASYLIPSDQGHILIDGGMPQNASQIIDNISALGFDIQDVKILLNSHAHFDHSGGLAELKQRSGATMIANEGDRSALEGGFYLGAEDLAKYAAPPVKVDKLINDGETVKLGSNELTASITPGHSRGCTSWWMTTTENGVAYDVLIFCSATVAGNRLYPEQYQGIVNDYRRTFNKARHWQPDIPLSGHPDYFFRQNDKRQAQLDGNPLAFVDRESFPVMIKKWEQSFEQKLLEVTSTQEQP